MRRPLDKDRLHRVLEELGRRARGAGRVYLVGGATALLVGWRQSTLDLDIKLEPEPLGIFEAIAAVKNELQVNIELASPDQFLPPLAGWVEASRFVARHGKVEFFHYDLRAQGLAKLARGHDRDIRDVEAMLERALITPDELRAGVEEIRGDLLRYPGLDAVAFEARVRDFVERHAD